MTAVMPDRRATAGTATIASLRMLVARRPRNPALRYQLAHAHAAAGQLPEALHAYEDALAEGPTHELLHRCLLEYAGMLAVLGEHSHSLQIYAELRRRFPLAPEPTLLDVFSLHRDGRANEAFATLLSIAAATHGPTDAEHFRAAFLRALAN